jgi:hypothetical protein
MPIVNTQHDVMAFRVLLLSWLAALFAIPFALLLAVLGQALGAILGGCSWIGVSLPLDRQAWALVNQPALNFAAQPEAFGYWLGSLLVPLLVAAVAVPLYPRTRSIAAEMVLIQIGWALIAVACAWMPLVDPVDGHLARWLYLRRLPAVLVWCAPLVATALALLPPLRLLAIARMARRDASRLRRIMLVALHLGLPLIAWTGLMIVMRREFTIAPTAALAAPLLAALGIASARYPEPHVKPLRELEMASFIKVGIAICCLLPLLWFGGRPLPEKRRAGLLWGVAFANNNVRPWIKASPLFGQPPPQPSQLDSGP